MVFGDISETSESSSHQAFQIPSPSDRFLSFAFDFVVASPVSGLVAVGFLKDLKHSFLSAVADAEILKSLIQWGFIYFSVYFLILSLFLYIYNATPGQLVFCLRTVNKQKGRLSLLQCWIRVAGPWLSLVFFGAPLLEMFSHKQRSTFYDRWSDTVVCTLKGKGERSPLEFEIRFIKQWTSISFMLVYLALFMQIFNFDKSTQMLAYDQEDFGPSCNDVMGNFKSQKLTALDRALTLWLLDKQFATCLKKILETENIFKKNSEQAYFASALLTEDVYLKEEYKKNLCASTNERTESASNEYCNLLSHKQIKKSDLNTLSSKVMWLQTQFQANADQRDLFLTLDGLVEEPLIFQRYVKEYVTSYLFTLKSSKVSEFRSPASEVEESKNIDKSIQEAQERFVKRMGTAK